MSIKHGLTTETKILKGHYIGEDGLERERAGYRWHKMGNRMTEREFNMVKGERDQGQRWG